MRTSVLLLVACAVILSAAPAFAQKSWLGVEGSAALPTGDLSDATISGGGGGVFWDFAFSKAFQTRVDANWIQFSSKSHNDDLSSKARVIPVRAGLNWVFGPEDGIKFYLGAMVGAYFQEVSITENGDKTTQEETLFGFAPCVGARIPIGSPGNELEVFASYDMWTDDTTSADEDLDMGFVRMGVGYRFGI